MNILRKAMAAEVVEFKPVLDAAYAAILRYQQDRTQENDTRLRAGMAPAIAGLMEFRALLPSYKQRDFRLLEIEWKILPAHDLIMLFDHCVSIMHVRLERTRSVNEREQPWSADMLRLLDSYRDTPAHTPVEGNFLCSGISASGGRATGMARVIVQDDFTPVGVGEIIVCRFTRPTLVPYMRGVKALITDEGGELCHAAILARELGLPCVTGCGDATAKITTGDALQVDGDLGLVMSLSKAAGGMILSGCGDRDGLNFDHLIRIPEHRDTK